MSLDLVCHYSMTKSWVNENTFRRLRPYAAAAGAALATYAGQPGKPRGGGGKTQSARRRRRKSSKRVTWHVPMRLPTVTSKTKNKAGRGKTVRKGEHSQNNKQLVYKPSKDYRFVKNTTNKSIVLKTNTIANFINTVVGTQIVATVLTGYSNSELDNYWNAGNNIISTGAVVSSYAHNQAGYLHNKLLLDNVNNEIKLSNVGMTDVEISIYWVVSKVTKPILVNAIADWDTGIAAQVHNNGASTKEAIYAKPTFSKLFNMNWKIVHKSHVIVNSGGEHTDKWIFRPRRVLDSMYWNTYQQIKGITYQAFAIVHGQVVTNGSTHGTMGTISTSSFKVPMIYKQQSVCRLGLMYPRAYDVDNNITSEGDALYEVLDVHEGQDNFLNDALNEG